MALVPCEACGNLVSDAALACPKCGHPQHAVSKPKARGLSAFALVITAALIGGLWLLNVAPSKVTSEPYATFNTENAVRRCAWEIDVNPDSKQALSKGDIERIDACVRKLREASR